MLISVFKKKSTTGNCKLRPEKLESSLVSLPEICQNDFLSEVPKNQTFVSQRVLK